MKKLKSQPTNFMPTLQSPTSQHFDITVLGEMKQILPQDLIDLPELIQVDSNTLTKIRELGSVVYNEKTLKMLHIFLYYCIKVANSIQMEGL